MVRWAFSYRVRRIDYLENPEKERLIRELRIISHKYEIILSTDEDARYDIAFISKVEGVKGYFIEICRRIDEEGAVSFVPLKVIDMPFDGILEITYENDQAIEDEVDYNG